MKKINLLYILLCVCFITNAQIQEETFTGTSLPTGWTATTPASGCAWQFGYTGAMPGTFVNPVFYPTGAALFDDNSCGSGFNNTLELVAPAVDLVAANVVSAAIEIVYNHQTFSNDGDFNVDVWDGSSWQNVLFVDGDSPSSSSGTNQTSIIDVTSHINAAFQVRFRYTDENSLTYGIAIDNYKLEDTATAGIDDLLSSGFSYYPNPVVNEQLTLNANDNISLVNIHNVIGQKVIAQKPANLKATIPMSNLPEGVYIVHVVIGEKEGSFKVIKQ